LNKFGRRLETGVKPVLPGKFVSKAQKGKAAGIGAIGIRVRNSRTAMTGAELGAKEP